jgi:hypothetical protein
MVVDEAFDKKCMAWWQKRSNLGGLQLLKKVFNIKTMLK